MPRRRRLWVPGAGAHTISRFVDRRFTLVDSVDRRSFLDAIQRANDRWDWLWLSYAAMSSHLHYGHVAGWCDPDRFFRSAHTRLAQRYHGRPGRRTLGPVFAERPVIHAVSQSALPRLVAYHHRNPVEAGLVRRPSESNWTSHRVYLRLDPSPPWFDVEHALHILGFRDTAAGRRRFDEFVMDVDLDERPWEPQPDSRAEASLCHGAESVDWTRLIDLAREVAGVPQHEPLISRRRHVVKARLLIAVIATRDFGQTYASVATRLGMTTGSAFNLVSRQGTFEDVETLLSEVRRRLTAK